MKHITQFSYQDESLTLTAKPKIFTCSRSIVETLEKLRNMFRVNNKRHQNNVNDVFLASLLITWNLFHPFLDYFHS